MSSIQWNINPYKDKNPSPYFTENDVRKAQTFHESIPGYKPTPLYSLKSLAKSLEVESILIKDESKRFGLNSFKGLGGSYAIANTLAERYNFPFGFYSEINERVKDKPQITFTTTTAGNHGRGVAWGAKIFGQKAVVYMPKGAKPFKIERIKEQGAETIQTDLMYDDAVVYTAKEAEKKGWTVIQDTAWGNYTKIPRLIMEGYLTIAGELAKQWEIPPTHIILQAGVGSLAGGVVEGILRFAPKNIKVIIVEPSRADCFYQSSLGHDGQPKSASGDAQSMMSGLSCREVSAIAWEILKKSADAFIICPDSIAAEGMRKLANPSGEDPKLVSGESGAVSLGILQEICQNPALKDFKKAMEINSSSRILLISTEGATDPDNYNKIVS